MTTSDDNTTRRSTLELSLNRIGVVKAIRLAPSEGVTATVAEATSLEAARAWREVLLKDPCPYCLGPGGTIDHVTPMSMGGAKGSMRNWSGACEACNVRRGSRGLIYFLAGAPDAAAEARDQAVTRLGGTCRIDIGPEIRADVEGVSGREARQVAARAVTMRYRTVWAEQRRRWNERRSACSASWSVGGSRFRNGRR